MSETLYLLLGFGGTGGKIIQQLAQVATNDPKAADLLRKRVSIILCDTDVGDLTNSVKDTKGAFNNRVAGSPPHIYSFQLGMNANQFQDLVQIRLETAQKSGDNGLRNYRDNWWFDQKAQPFSAHRMPMAISAGAAQCPMVSHFLAWDELRRFETILQRVIDDATNLHHMENFSVEMFLLSSLAGGTGRGCWQLLSLKAREFFGASGRACRPTGFFLDASAFEMVMKNRPDQKVKLSVNALTGMSELAMWLRESKEPEKRILVPDMADPANEPASVIDTDRFMPEEQVARRGRSPIHRAYVFSSRSTSAHLDRSEDVFKACAAVVYSKLSSSKTRSSDANSPARAAASATSLLYVPISDIQHAFRMSAKAQRAKRFIEGEASVSVGGVNARRPIVELADWKPGDKARNYKLNTDTEPALKAQSLVDWFNQITELPDFENFNPPDPKSGEASKIWHGLATYLKGLELEEGLRDEVSEVMKTCARDAGKTQLDNFSQQVEAIYSRSHDLNREFAKSLRKCIDMEKADGEFLPDRMLWDYLQKSGKRASVGQSEPKTSLQALGGAERDSGSPALLDWVLNQLKSEINKKLADISARLKELDPKSKERTEAVAEIKRNFEDGLRLWNKLPILKHWLEPFGLRSEQDMTQLISDERIARAEGQILQHYKQLFQQLAARIDQVQTRTKPLIGATLLAGHRHQLASSKLREECFTTVGNGRAGSETENLFKELERLALENLAPVTRIIRKIRPVFDAVSYNEALQKAVAGSSNGPTKESLWLEAILTNPTSELNVFNKPLTGNSAVSRFEQQVSDALDKMIDDQAIEPEVLEKQFNLPRVLEEYLAFWIDTFSSYGSPDTQTKISEAVEDVLGINIGTLYKAARREQNDGTGNGRIVAPKKEDIVCYTSLRLATKCDPLVTFSAGWSQSGNTVCVFLPAANRGEAERMSDRIRLEAQKAIDTIAHVQVEPGSDNPYILMVTSEVPKSDIDTRGWDGWESYAYWRSPAILDWLRLCEKPTGESVFTFSDDSVGLGYLSPKYVRDPYFSRKRWKPWVDASHSDRKWRALAYALIGNNPYRPEGKNAAGLGAWWPAYQEFIEVLRGLVLNTNYADDKLTLPLILEAPNDKAGPEFQRRLLVKENGGLRLNGEDLGHDNYKFSLRSFVLWFNNNSESTKQQQSDFIFDAIWNEYEVLCEYLRSPERFGASREQTEKIYSLRSPESIKSVNEFLREYVREWREHVKNGKGGRPEDRELGEKFLTEFKKFLDNSDVLSLLNSTDVDGR